MNIKVTEENGCYLLIPEGSLDYITSPELDNEVTKAAENATRLVIDMGNVSYIASAGLRVLLNADDLMSEKEGMYLRNVNDYVMDILKMTDFISVLKIEE